MTRTLPTYLAPIVEELELEQASLVTTDDLRRIAESRGIRTGAAKIAAALRDRGWLLTTGTKGILEFAPGAHAGPFGRVHPFRAVQAALLANPDAGIDVCLNSALWAHGLLDSAPDRPEVALMPGSRVPNALQRQCRVVKFRSCLPTLRLWDVQVHDLATVLVHLATTPKDVCSWGVVMEVLPTLVAAVMEADAIDNLFVELAPRPASVRTRLAYLVHGLAPELASTIAPAGHGVVWFGPRGRATKRFNSTYQVADTVLPMAPGELRNDDLISDAD